MKRTIIERPPGSFWVRIGWFVGIWAASVAALGVVAYALHWIFLG